MKVKLVFVGLVLLLCGCDGASNSVYNRVLPGLNQQSINLEHLKENPYNVFIAFANDCPVCKSCIPTIQKIHQRYPQIGLVLFYPNNPLDTAMNHFISSLLPAGVITVKDKNKGITKCLKASVTPHSFVLDSAGAVIYKGAIDNSVFTNYRKNYAQQNSYLLNALDTLINLKKPLIENETKVVGCYIE